MQTELRQKEQEYGNISAAQTITYNKEEITLQNEGRHDPCVLPRAVPIVEAMAAIVIVNCKL